MSDNEAREYTPTMKQIREAASSWHDVTWTKAEVDRAIAAHMAPKLTADQLTELEAAFAEELSMGGDASMMAATVRIFLEEQVAPIAAKAEPPTIDREEIKAEFVRVLASMDYEGGANMRWSTTTDRVRPTERAFTVAETLTVALEAHLSAQEAASDDKAYAQGYLDGQNAAQEAATEVEWEYGVRRSSFGGRVMGRYATLADAESDTTPLCVVVRRRKIAGLNVWQEIPADPAPEQPVASQYDVDRHAEKQGVSYADAWRYFEREGYDMSKVDDQYKDVGFQQ